MSSAYKPYGSRETDACGNRIEHLSTKEIRHLVSEIYQQLAQIGIQFDPNIFNPNFSPPTSIRPARHANEQAMLSSIVNNLTDLEGQYPEDTRQQYYIFQLLASILKIDTMAEDTQAKNISKVDAPTPNELPTVRKSKPAPFAKLKRALSGLLGDKPKN